MGDIILFECYTKFRVCAQRLDILRHLNPGIPIYGLYGGPPGSFSAARRLLGSRLENLYRFPTIGRAALRRNNPRRDDLVRYRGEQYWKWKNIDLVICEWYRRVGRRVPFRTVYCVQWDQLILEPVASAHRRVPRGAVGLSGVQALRAIGHRWSWVRREPRRSAFLALIEHAQRAHGYRGDPLCCFGAGYALPRDFLERYAAIRPPPFSIDEIRLPLYAQILGFPVHDTGFCATEYDEESLRAFNTDRQEVPVSLVARSLEHPRGRRVFHPCTRMLPGSLVRRMRA